MEAERRIINERYISLVDEWVEICKEHNLKNGLGSIILDHESWEDQEYIIEQLVCEKLCYGKISGFDDCSDNDDIDEEEKE